MATLYSNTFDTRIGVTALSQTLTVATSPPENTASAIVTSIQIEFYKPSFNGTYTMRMRVQKPDSTWTDYVTEDVVWSGQEEQTITFTFPSVNAKVDSSDYMYVNISKQPGSPPYTTYITYDSTGPYLVIAGSWVSEAELPSKAITPAPSNADSSVTLDQATITWKDGGGATSFNVYYGTSPGNLSLVSLAQAGLTFSLAAYSPYDYGVTRYWRIDSVNVYGTTTGDEWSFTTITFNPPTPPVDSDENPTGENCMFTIKKLVAVAENRFWHEDI